MRIPTICGVIALSSLLAGAQVSPQEALRQQLKDDLVGAWVYNDADAGFAEAKKTGKPLLVVFR